MDMIEKSPEKTHFSVVEVAKIMGISRVAILKKITLGRLPAQKVGRSYVIARADLETALGSVVSPEQRKEIEHIVKGAVKEYGVTFCRLGKEE
ncbi:MAG: helix-turn-helix domain-containing protein [Candidatus Kaiserbacteria bacterium]|nr:helix-turn-helix domain-containing protein [Candidatus Kaiserbacteria bacterium]